MAKAYKGEFYDSLSKRKITKDEAEQLIRMKVDGLKALKKMRYCVMFKVDGKIFRMSLNKTVDEMVEGVNMDTLAARRMRKMLFS